MKMCINCLLPMEDQQTQCPHCGYTEGVNPMDYCHLPPRTVLNGRYITGRPMGSGGFGVTYIAWDTVLEIRVAIKEFMPGELAKRTAGTHDVLVNPSANELYSKGKRGFMEESMRLARLGDIPGVVKIFDCFEANGTAYIVMEYLEGQTLQSWLEANGRMPVDMCVPIIVSVLGALEKIHAAGLMHRDIAPDNIMLCNDGRVVLIDFGAARHMTTRHSRSLSTVLKIGYAPVEQYYRDGNQDSWTDIYAVGATMYHALTGVIPPDAFTRANNDALVKPSTYAPIPKDIEVAILNAMNVTIEKRTKTAAEFAAQLMGQMKAVRVQEHIRPEQITVSGKTKAALIASIVAVAAVIALIAFGVPQLILPDTQAKVPEGMSRVPAIQTMPIDDAESLLSDSDLRLRIAELIHDDFFDRDIVLYQNPGAGTVAYIGSMVDVTVSAPEETVPVPAVTGFDAAAAQEALEAAGFVVVTREEFDDTIAPGAIVYQSVSPEENAKPGTVIELVISKGPENSTIDTSVEVTVPGVTGMTFEQAQQAMQAQGLYVVIGSTEFSDTVPSGQIIRQTPAQTANAHQGDTVTVVVSKGEETAIVPDVRYNSEQAARTRITNSNLGIKVNYEESTTVSSGLVIRQDIAAGTTLNPGDTVTVWVSTGYQVTVPDCVGKTQLEAADLLSTARLSYTFTTQNSATVPEGQIISQSVNKGQKVEQGTTVTLVVSTGTRTVPVTGVSLSQSRLTMNIGDSATLAATVKPADATTAAVTWKSDNTAVAQVDASGKVTARGAGTATITVTTADGGKTASCTVTVSRTLSSIDIISQPTKTSYFLKGNLDKTGLSVRAAYNDGTTADVTSKCTLSGFDSSSAGTKTVTVSYAENGITRNDSFTVVVSAPLLSSITVNSYPSKTAYYAGETLDRTGLSVTAYYTDGSSANVSDRCTLSGFDGSRNGSQTITVSYSEGSIIKTASYSVTVTPVPLSSIAITSSPRKTSYYIGDSLDTAGLVVTATYTNNATAVVTDKCSFSGFDSSSGGTKTVTVSYTDGGVTRTANFSVSITVPSITVTPSTLTMDMGGSDQIIANTVPAGMPVSWKSSDESVILIHSDGYYMAADAGQATVTASFVLNGKTYSATCQALVYGTSTNMSQFTYELKNNEITIIDYIGSDTEVVIPSGFEGNDVTAIGNQAFLGSNVRTVTIPSTVKRIGSEVFTDCAYLEDVYFECSNVEIGDSTFVRCVSMDSVDLPKGLKAIPAAMFFGCEKLTSVTVPEGVKTLGDGAFTDCTALRSVSLPSTLTGIGDDAFYNCHELASINIPNGVTSIGDGAFWGCTKLASVTVPYGVASMGDHVFTNCDSLTSITIPDSVTDIGSDTFFGCSSLTSVDISNGLTDISTRMFNFCGSLPSVTIPDGVTVIGEQAFDCCENLTSVTIPDSVSNIEKRAFFGCEKLTSIAIPDSVTGVGENAFLFCYNLTIYCNPGSAAYNYAVEEGYATAPYDQYPG